MSQPNWKYIANLGDANPIDHGGFFVYIDETGVYDPEVELLGVIEENDCGEASRWVVYRFSLERCTFEDGILSNNKFHKDHAAWFAEPECKRAERPQDTTYLSKVAECMGMDLETLQTLFCSDNPIERAEAYRCVGEYHGFGNLDSYPLTLTDGTEVEQRYAEETSKTL